MEPCVLKYARLAVGPFSVFDRHLTVRPYASQMKLSLKLIRASGNNTTVTDNQRDEPECQPAPCELLSVKASCSRFTGCASRHPVFFKRQFIFT